MSDGDAADLTELEPPRRAGSLKTRSLVVGGVLLVVAGAALFTWKQVKPVVESRKYAKVTYEVRSDGSIVVPRNKVHEIRAQLAGKGLPRGEGIGFELLDQPNFGLSDFVQRANFTRALQGELARTISQMDQVDGARVSGKLAFVEAADAATWLAAVVPGPAQIGRAHV